MGRRLAPPPAAFPLAPSGALPFLLTSKLPISAGRGGVGEGACGSDRSTAKFQPSLDIATSQLLDMQPSSHAPSAARSSTHTSAPSTPARGGEPPVGVLASPVAHSGLWTSRARAAAGRRRRGRRTRLHARAFPVSGPSSRPAATRASRLRHASPAKGHITVASSGDVVVGSSPCLSCSRIPCLFLSASLPACAPSSNRMWLPLPLSNHTTTHHRRGGRPVMTVSATVPGWVGGCPFLGFPPPLDRRELGPWRPDEEARSQDRSLSLSPSKASRNQSSRRTPPAWRASLPFRVRPLPCSSTSFGGGGASGPKSPERPGKRPMGSLKRATDGFQPGQSPPPWRS